MSTSEDHALAENSENRDPPFVPKQEPREIHPVVFGEPYDLDFRPINTVGMSEDLEIDNPKDSSALEPAESSESDTQVQTPSIPVTSSKAAPATTAIPNAGKASTQDKA